MTDSAALLISRQPLGVIDDDVAALIRQRYTEMGYRCPDFSAQQGMAETACRLVARQAGQVRGTLLLRHDGAQRLWADHSHPLQMQRLRRAGQRLLEVGNFATERHAGLAVSRSLIRETVTYAVEHGVDCLLIEINPRHQRFYQQLGFAAQASERHCARAGAAAVLMAAPVSALLHVLANQPLAHAA